jgi:transposase
MEFNIEVEFIKPQYTSQRCNKCGCIDKENRQTQEQFVCTTCGHKDNADRNASRNIAYPNIQEIIEEQLEIQRYNK